MSLKLREEYQYSLLVPTSMGVRLTPADHQPCHSSDTFRMHATSAETNVVSIAASLGLPVKVLTTFVQGSPVARFIKSSLAARGMVWEGPEVEQGGPWGYRHQINIADTGYGTRGPRVHNDRAGEVGRTLTADLFDLERIFGAEGVQIVHISGLIAALSPETGQFCLELARKARSHGTLISFDLNYRESFWKGGEKELRTLFRGIASLADIITGNEEDYQLSLGIEGPDTGGKDIGSTMTSFREMIAKVKKEYPDTTVYANTLREVVNANSHQWGAIMAEGDNWHTIEPREIGVLDRIGGGDGFVGGLLYGILRGWEPEEWLQFGWATGAMAVTLNTDYAEPADEEQVWSIWKGNARVKR